MACAGCPEATHVVMCRGRAGRCVFFNVAEPPNQTVTRDCLMAQSSSSDEGKEKASCLLRRAQQVCSKAFRLLHAKSLQSCLTLCDPVEL